MGAMLRRMLLNLALLLLVAGVGVWGWQLARQPEKTSEALLSLGKGEINQLIIMLRPGTAQVQTIRMQKYAAEQWKMLEPQQANVNPVRVTQLLTLLDEVVNASYDVQGKDLTQYALQPGNVTLTLNDQTLVFGMENPVSHQRYILHNGKIKLVSEAVYGLLIGAVQDWLAD